MQRACELLMSSSLTIGEIGAQLGYEDPMYFSRLFRKKIGIPARDYRRRGELRAVWNT
jgi:YesN/AraC family two-component response regulator